MHLFALDQVVKSVMLFAILMGKFLSGGCLQAAATILIFVIVALEYVRTPFQNAVLIVPMDVFLLSLVM